MQDGKATRAMITASKNCCNHMPIETSSIRGTDKIMVEECIKKDVTLRRDLRARLVENIIALGDLIDVNNITEIGKRFFYEIIKVEAMNLKDLDLLEAESISHTSRTENDASTNTRKISSARLLNNIRALGELSAMSTTSEAGKTLFWEAIKLEIETFDSEKVESEESTKLDATVSTAKLTNSFSEPDSNTSLKSTLLSSHPLLFSCFKPKKSSFTKSGAIPDRIDFTTKHTQDSSSNRTLGTFACSSLRTSGNESKVGLKKEGECTRSFQPLPRLCQSHASRSEWLRTVQGPIQHNGVMEMVVYLTEKDGAYFFAANE